MARSLIVGTFLVVAGGCNDASASSLPRRCPEIHVPVCAAKNGVPRLYANLCDAGRAGAVRAEMSACRPAVCPMIYAPVCATKQGINKTYANSCMAKAAGATVREHFTCVKM